MQCSSPVAGSLNLWWGSTGMWAWTLVLNSSLSSTQRTCCTDLKTLALALPKRQLALQKSTAEQRLMWEMLRVLDKAQNKERDQDIAHTLRLELLCFNARDSAFAPNRFRPDISV